jgi:tetratricopeptide (TPR) repeat protein
MNYERSLQFASKALSLNTYDAAGNFAYGLASLALENITDAKESFAIASSAIEFRGASFTELSKLYFRLGQLDLSFDYARKALVINAQNLEALQVMSVIHRKQGEKDKALQVMDKILGVNGLSHFVNIEKFLWHIASIENFTQQINQEMRDEVFLNLASWYQNLNLTLDAAELLKYAPQQTEILYWRAYLLNKLNDSSWSAMLAQADQTSVKLVFPYTVYSSQVMVWAATQTPSWKPKYLLSLIHWNAGNSDKAKNLMEGCGNPDFAPFHAAKYILTGNESEQNLQRATQLDPGEWRYGRLTINHFLNAGNSQKALTVAFDCHKKFPDNDVISFLLARCYLLNKQYVNSFQLLTSKTFLPNEGSTEGRQLYREALLMMAFDQMEKNKFDEALRSIGKARQWPENLGVGKPYDEDNDERLEKYMMALCYMKLNKKNEANKLFSQLASEMTKHAHINLFINALVLKTIGDKSSGNQLLENWKETTSNQALANWTIQLYNNNIQDPPQANDQTRLIHRLALFIEQKI